MQNILLELPRNISILIGFHHLAIYHIHTSAIVHTVNSTELHMIGNHVDRQRREWYMLSIPVSSYPCGVVRFKAVVYGKHVKEEFPFHIVKAPHPRNSHYYIDHKQVTCSVQLNWDIMAICVYNLLMR